MVSESYQQAGIPINWHAALLRAVRKPLVAEGLTNREFEGDLANGNTVRIVMTADVAIANYDRNTPITASILPLADQTLLADQQKSFNFQTNDLDVKQVKPAFVEEQSARAIYNKFVIDNAPAPSLGDLYARQRAAWDEAFPTPLSPLAASDKRYSPEELLEVATRTLLPIDQAKRTLLIDLIAALRRPDVLPVEEPRLCLKCGNPVDPRRESCPASDCGAPCRWHRPQAKSVDVSK